MISNKLDPISQRIADYLEYEELGIERMESGSTAGMNGFKINTEGLTLEQRDKFNSFMENIFNAAPRRTFMESLRSR